MLGQNFRHRDADLAAPILVVDASEDNGSWGDLGTAKEKSAARAATRHLRRLGSEYLYERFLGYRSEEIHLNRAR